ncbi:MAG: hypothetical protein ABH843_03370 [Candidatus Omnitrophota bacterium]
MGKKENEFVCYDCFKLKKCRESAVSWVFFFIALVAVIALRAVNVVFDFHPLLAKIFWYVGVVGFFVFFLYKFRYDRLMRKELEETKLVDKMLSRGKLTDHDYDVLGTIICKLSSKKDSINYFFIFFFSGIALVLAVYADFLR